MTCYTSLAIIVMACLAASKRAPAEGSALLQSSQLELGRSSEIRESHTHQERTPQVGHGHRLVAGFFIKTVLNEDRISLLQREPIDDSEAEHVLQILCSIVLVLLVCLVLVMFTSTDDIRPKLEPEGDAHHSTLPHAATSAVPLSAQGPTGLRPVQTWPAVDQSLEEVDRHYVSSPQSSLNSVRFTSESMMPPTRGRAKVEHLCSGLVVPGGSECVLAVRLPPSSVFLEAQVDVMDLTGQAVLAATLRLSNQQARDPAVVLKPTSATPNGNVANQELARCYANRGSDGEIGIDICKANGEIYARMSRDHSRPRYVMTKTGSNPAAPVNIVFDGLFKEHAILVSDGVLPEPVADAEPCSMSFDPNGTYYRLRVSSNVDVGLMICCLLSIDELVRLGA